MQTLSEEQLIGQVLGKYRVERFMGKGRLSAVYLARHVTSYQVDALTVYLLPEHLSAEACNRFLQRFLKEAALVTALHHPHILSIYDYGELAGSPYLVTPYTMQGSLADSIKQQGRCGHAYVSSLLSQIASGLNYAHQRRFVHGTLKPANIVLSGEDSIQVAGFGLMHMLQRSGIEPITQPYEHLLSVADTFLAAAEYIAPEVVQGKNIDARSDVYALGCILYELLGGRPPFVGPDPFETAQHHVQHNAPSLRTLATDVPIAVVSVVSQALDRDPARRFQSVLELDEAFAQASQGAIHFTQPVPVIQPSTMQPRLTRNLYTVSGEQSTSGQSMSRSLNANTSGNWQLLPPIVTGRVPAVQPGTIREDAQRSRQANYSRELLPDTDPHIVPVPPTLPPTVPANYSTGSGSAKKTPDASLQSQSQAQAQSEHEYPADVSFVGTPEQVAEDARSYAWWSPETPAKPKPVEQGTPRGIPSEAQTAGDKDMVRLPAGGELNWMMEPPVPPSASSKRRAQTTVPRQEKTQKVRRRKVVAMLATGVVAVGAGAVGVKAGVLHLGGITTQQTAMTQAPQPTTGQKTAAKTTKQTGGQKKGQTATVGKPISTTRQAVNTAVAFKNPQDQQDSLLIRLPDGNFVAYKRACTHQGVDVNYDPATQTLICPLHGATFDAKNKAAVLKGPAMTPLAMTAVRINANGVVSVV